MPTYEITHPDTGVTLEFEGSAPPPKAVIDAAFIRMGSKPVSAAPSYDRKWSRGINNAEQRKSMQAEDADYPQGKTAEQQRIDFVKNEGMPETQARYAQPYSNVSFGQSRPVDTRKISYTPSGYQPNQPATDVKSFAKNLVQDVVTAPLMPVQIAKDVINSPDTLSTLKDVAKGVFTTPAGFFPGLSDLATGKSASENWATNPGIGLMSLSPLAKAGAKGISSASDIVKRPVDFKNGMTELSAQYNIPLTLSELKNKVSSKTDTFLEGMPSVFGTKKFRELQGKAAETSAREHFAQYTVEPNATTTAAMKEANNTIINDMYAKVRESVPESPIANPISTAKEATILLNQFPKVFESIQNKKMKTILSNIIDDLSVKTETSKILDESGKPITRKVDPKISLDDLWELRQGIGAEIADAKTTIAEARYKQLYSAISNDMESFMGKETAKDFRAANEAFKQYNIKFDVLRKAYDQAMGTTGASTEGFFSPQAYGKALKNLANDPTYKADIKWSPQEIQNMTGLANILQVAKRGSQYLENPPTGVRWGQLSAVTSALGGGAAVSGALGVVGGAAAGAAISALTKFLTTNPKGIKLASMAANMPPTSKTMKSIVREVYNSVPELSAKGVIGKETMKQSSSQGE